MGQIPSEKIKDLACTLGSLPAFEEGYSTLNSIATFAFADLEDERDRYGMNQLFFGAGFHTNAADTTPQSAVGNVLGKLNLYGPLYRNGHPLKIYLEKAQALLRDEIPQEVRTKIQGFLETLSETP